MRWGPGFAIGLFIVPCLFASKNASADDGQSASMALQPEPKLKRFGLMADVGLPDGANLSLVARPLCWLRLHAGASHNLVNFGVRGGASVGTCFSYVNPTLSVEAGHFFEGDANKIARKFSGDNGLDIAAFRKFGYSYANAHLGLEFGSETVTFYVHGGLSFFQSKIHMDEEEVAVSDIPIRGYSVSAKLGLIFYLF